jgi:hypothetical protein
MMKSFDMKSEAYLFGEIVKEFLYDTKEIWKDKEELKKDEEEDAQYAQALFRSKMEEYLKGKFYFKQIRGWLEGLYKFDKQIDWGKDREKFLQLVKLYEKCVDNYRKIKLGSAKEAYESIPRK